MSTPPLSWLLLERYHLGELDPTERRQIEDHLVGCPASRDRLQQIRHDHRPLSALPVPQARPVPRRRWLWAAPALIAVAAAALLWVPATTEPVPPDRILVRGGGEIAVALTRERAGQIQPDPQVFADGDRFSVRLTCPPAQTTAWTLTAFQGSTAIPLAAGVGLSCGSLRPLPGAFALDGVEAVLVCATLSETPPRRPAEATVCRRLEPADL